MLIVGFTLIYKSFVTSYKEEKEREKNMARLEDFEKIIKDYKTLNGEDEYIIKYEKEIFQAYLNGKIKRRCEETEKPLSKCKLIFHYIIFLVILLSINIIALFLEFQTSIYPLYIFLLYIINMLFYTVWFILFKKHLFNEINLKMYTERTTNILVVYLLASIIFINSMIN